MWKRVPHRIKGLLKRDQFDPTSPPPFSKPTPLITRIFTSHNKNKKHSKLKSKQWKTHSNNEVHASELDFTEVPLRANMMSIFHAHQQQSGWSSLLSASNKSLDVFSRVYLSTLAKARSLSHYSLEQQLSVHHMLTYIQNRNQRELRDFNSILTNRVCDAILMNNRKTRRTRYIFMLLSTPSSHVVDKLHPVTEALSKLRRPYAETVTITTAADMLEEQREEEDEIEIKMQPELKEEKIIKFGNLDPLSHVVAYKFVPADYLLDPATLRGPDVPHHHDHHQQQQNRLGTKFNGCTDQNEQQQKQQQQQQKQPALYNKDMSSIAPIMAKIQIQTN